MKTKGIKPLLVSGAADPQTQRQLRVRRTAPGAPASAPPDRSVQPRLGANGIAVEGGTALHVHDKSAEPVAGTAVPDPVSPGDDARLASHLRNLGRMYPVLAHDLHSFLNTMVLNLELLQRAAAREDPDPATLARIRRFAALVAEEIPPLDRMLKAVVGQTRLSDPPTTRFDFRALCEDLAIVFDSYARYRRLRLKATLVDVPMAVAGDRDAMAHALTALLLHALEAAPPGTDLTLSLQADRRLATLALAAAAPAVLTREPAMRESAAAAREVLQSLGARIDDSPGADGSSALGITVPLVPLIS